MLERQRATVAFAAAMFVLAVVSGCTSTTEPSASEPSALPPSASPSSAPPSGGSPSQSASPDSTGEADSADGALHVTVARPDVSVRYVVANPSSYLYFDNQRPDGGGFRTLTAAEVSACSSYNTYKYGLTQLNSYASASTSPLAQRYEATRVDYLLGELDTDVSDSSLDTSCAANWQGRNRYERGQTYFRYLGLVLVNSVYERQSLAVVPGVGHSAHDMFTSTVGAQTLFP